MLIRDIRSTPLFTAGDRTHLREILHPKNEPECKNRCSLAHAFLGPGEASLPHRLKTSSETYYILSGEGLMHIDDESAPVCAGQVIYIPAGAVQSIENTGEDDLVIFAVVDPAWDAGDEEVLG
ncbi:cupin domain-containing protein [Methanofollis aquaemaris]|uniref:Cupin domain-containing protein n=1 Tax=Methanofollis aquaemaris TaxID=126734 RepID=A0A8A3S5M2_9EURY|nr:cupin domain-containing protein [Methanofollis aquaemaris]QSZ67438.1 cupin domain-containing protein [Methanofollis aquaemaris]